MSEPQELSMNTIRKHTKQMIVAKGDWDELPQYHKEWLNGTIGWEQFRELNHEYLMKKGWFKASGTWYPRKLLDAGAVLIVRKKGYKEPLLSIVYTEQSVTRVKDGKSWTLMEMCPHPEWKKWCMGEEDEAAADRKFEAYADHVAEEYDDALF